MPATPRIAHRWLLPALTAAAVVAALTVDVRPASAGACGGDEDVRAMVKDVERFAKRGGKAPEIPEFCDDDALAQPALARRLFQACEQILVREPGFLHCLEWAADAGKQKLGTVEIYPQLATLRTVDPFGPYLDGAYNVGLYKRLGDPRAAGPVREMWRATLGNPRTTKKHDAYLWKVFRNNAIALFDRVGGAAERDFLAAQLPATKDRAMKKRMQKAIAAIDKRLAKQP